MEVLEKRALEYHPPEPQSWIISGVSYKGEIRTYEIIGEMIKASAHDESAKRKGLEIPSLPLLISLGARTYEIRNENPEAFKSLVRFPEIRSRIFMGTSTRVIYEHKGKGKIIHDYGTPREETIMEEVIDPRYWVPDIRKKLLESLLGTSDVSRIEKSFVWMGGLKGGINLMDSEPDERRECITGFTYRGGGFDCGACLDIECNTRANDTFDTFRVLRID